MRITNNYSAALGFPGGQVIEAGDTAEFTGNWPEAKKHQVVAAWVKAEMITVEGEEAAADDGKAKPEKAPKLPDLPKP